MRLAEGNLFFRNISTNKQTYEYLNRNIGCDILIIGGGVSGLITAYYMSEEGKNVILVDKNIIGFGSTSSNIGMLDFQLNIEQIKLFKKIGYKKAKRCAKLCIESLNEIERIVNILENKESIGFKRVNSILYTNKYINKSMIVKEYNAKLNSGLNAEIINDNECIDIRHGIEIKNGSAVMNVYEFTKELASYLSKKENVKIFEHTEIEKIKSKDDYIEAITNNKFKIKANNVIITEGAEIINNFPEMPVDLYKTYNIVTEPIAELGKVDTNFTARNIEMPYEYMRFTHDNRIVFGGLINKITEKEQNTTISKQIVKQKYKRLYKLFQETFYNLKEIKVEFCFTGIYAETKDTLPIIDEMPGMSNVYCNLSYGINGILYSIIGAKMLKEINREHYAKDMHMFSVKR
ncbi:MAG: FAD-dependent oxidoreductase [Clostridia bacterium]|nr:FAD-dependent oxidoreductase [Clostridia bacterium]MDD4375723.1 FAD-dependent oxidoreductase [Clostridia bacterium]